MSCFLRGSCPLSSFQTGQPSLMATASIVFESSAMLRRSCERILRITSTRCGIALKSDRPPIMIRGEAFDYGYGSASLRERLYCDTDSDQNSMCGVLIYTASGDSEGSMGGLIRHGEPRAFERLIARAIDRARWCSSDPVCIESSGQGADICNLAACHGCCLVPETFCEEGNRILDRALLVGTPAKDQMGFFATAPIASTDSKTLSEFELKRTVSRFGPVATPSPSGSCRPKVMLPVGEQAH